METKTEFKIGDIVHWDIKPDVHFIIEDIQPGGWIWSSGLDIPYTNNHTKNFHNPCSYYKKLVLSKQHIRNKKLEELGI
jgi:hypothetical protein